MLEIRSNPTECLEAYLGSCQTCMTDLLWKSIKDVWRDLKHASLSEEKMKENRAEVKSVYLISQAKNKK